MEEVIPTEEISTNLDVFSVDGQPSGIASAAMALGSVSILVMYCGCVSRSSKKTFIKS